jgi:hypothetical protein
VRRQFGGPVRRISWGVNFSRRRFARCWRRTVTNATAPGTRTYGATDGFGWHAVQNRVHVHDLHATILHLMGIDHEKLTYRYSGRDYRLTDVSGRVVHDILA